MSSPPLRTRSANTNYARRSRRSPQLLVALQERRERAAALFAEGVRPARVAAQLGVSRQATSGWFALWQQGGVAALKLSERFGRHPKLTDEQLVTVETVLLQGARASGYTTEVWTLQRVAEVIAQRTGVVYHPGHVWRLLRYMGWSRQRPARRAKERDEAAIEHWVKTTWPALKRGPTASGAGSSSKTRADSR
jgi:transposase